MLDLLVVGAGPHALSLLCRLVDDEPDLLTERERVHIMAKAGSRSRSHAAVRKHLKKRFDGATKLSGVSVVDINGSWMTQWERDFAALAIPHTRSHADLHPCPFDFQSLRVWAEMQRREDEMWPMQYIDRDSSRAQGYAGPFVLPGTRLFNDFCRSLAERYNLQPLVRRGCIADVRIVPSASGPCTFIAVLADGTELAARRVVCAMGPGPMFLGMRATLPWWAEDLAAELRKSDEENGTHDSAHRMLHSSQIVPWLLGADMEASQPPEEGRSRPSAGCGLQPAKRPPSSKREPRSGVAEEPTMAAEEGMAASVVKHEVVGGVADNAAAADATRDSTARVADAAMREAATAAFKRAIAAGASSEVTKAPQPHRSPLTLTVHLSPSPLTAQRPPPTAHRSPLTLPLTARRSPSLSQVAKATARTEGQAAWKAACKESSKETRRAAKHAANEAKAAGRSQSLPLERTSLVAKENEVAAGVGQLRKRRVLVIGGGAPRSIDTPPVLYH